MSSNQLSSEHYALLLNLSKVGISTDDAEEVTHKLLALLVDEMPFDYGSAHFWNSGINDFRLVAHIGNARLVVPSQEALNDSDHEFHQVVRESRAKVLYRTLQSDLEKREFTHLVFPLRSENNLAGIGVLVARGRITMDENLQALLPHLETLLGRIIANAGQVQQLRNNEREIRRISKFPRENPNPLFCANKNGNVTYMNQAMLDFLKLNRIGAISNIQQLFNNDAKSYSHVCRSVGEDIISKNREFKIASRIMLGSVSSYQGAEEAFVYLQDITELKTLAQEMTRKNQELIDIKEELEFQTRRALDSSRHKSEFLANMSHELRTPLNSIIGFSEVLLDELFGDLNDKQKEYTNDILESGRHLLSLINDILDLSKIEAGKMDLELSEFSIEELITVSMSLMREKASKHNIGVSVDVDEDLDHITADERKVKQVVFNLLSNALKFTPDKGKVGVRVSKEGNDFVKFCVWDSGIGISIEDQKQIFEEFQQGDGSLTKRFEGAGLGLAIVKKFVELHGGKVWVESKLNMSTRFYFTIPMESPKWLQTIQGGIQ